MRHAESIAFTYRAIRELNGSIKEGSSFSVNQNFGLPADTPARYTKKVVRPCDADKYRVSEIKGTVPPSPRAV